LLHSLWSVARTSDFEPRSFNVIDPDYRDLEAEKGIPAVFEDGTPASYTPVDKPLYQPNAV